MAATAPDRLAALIDMITGAAPNTLLVVAQIVPTTTTLMVDELHPNPAGYALLGQTWYGVIATYLR